MTYSKIWVEKLFVKNPKNPRNVLGCGFMKTFAMYWKKQRDQKRFKVY
ncbi:hypothetical protein CIPAW_16G109900 [Carya illinoinensis]|uniref:Uncharacterized protein n=1 Tax=Carya illinoinensis TaxID=32201 RepID=A0A8T1N9Z7_CARIL|nr:hypothetical protein CIPAW_16G109900 [Carya illinoinensis]